MADLESREAALRVKAISGLFGVWRSWEGGVGRVEGIRV